MTNTSELDPTNLEYNKRLLRGHQMIEDGIKPEKIALNQYLVPSQTSDAIYIVSMHYNKWNCTCPDFTYRHLSCKHIHAVSLWTRLSKKLEEEPKSEPVALPDDRIVCKFCGSDHFIKYGKAHNKQVYKCKSCERKFVANTGFEGMWYDARIVATTLDLYFKGCSLRKIADHLKQFYGLPIDHSSVYRWIGKYNEALSDYISTLEPEVGNIWHTDEMKVKIGGEWQWLWNVMDEKTRFQLVGVLTKTRERQDAKGVFKEAKKVAGKRPRIMVTDGLQSYKRAFKDVFFDYSRYSHHVADAGLKESLNNSLERLNGTVREREKVMRGLKEEQTPIIPMNKIYYNFIRPHQGLEGKTPAEVAGIGIDGENKWIELLEKSIRRRI